MKTETTPVHKPINLIFVPHTFRYIAMYEETHRVLQDLASGDYWTVDQLKNSDIRSLSGIANVIAAFDRFNLIDRKHVNDNPYATRMYAFQPEQTYVDKYDFSVVPCPRTGDFPLERTRSFVEVNGKIHIVPTAFLVILEYLQFHKEPVWNDRIVKETGYMFRVCRDSLALMRTMGWVNSEKTAIGLVFSIVSDVVINTTIVGSAITELPY
jgi:hypothetical protein